jgi:hypothetical protein
LFYNLDILFCKLQWMIVLFAEFGRLSLSDHPFFVIGVKSVRKKHPILIQRSGKSYKFAIKPALKNSL